MTTPEGQPHTPAAVRHQSDDRQGGSQGVTTQLSGTSEGFVPAGGRARRQRIETPRGRPRSRCPGFRQPLAGPRRPARQALRLGEASSPIARPLQGLARQRQGVWTMRFPADISDHGGGHEQRAADECGQPALVLRPSARTPATIAGSPEQAAMAARRTPSTMPSWRSVREASALASSIPSSPAATPSRDRQSGRVGSCPAPSHLRSEFVIRPLASRRRSPHARGRRFQS